MLQKVCSISFAGFVKAWGVGAEDSGVVDCGEVLFVGEDRDCLQLYCCKCFNKTGSPTPALVQGRNS